MRVFCRLHATETTHRHSYKTKDSVTLWQQRYTNWSQGGANPRFRTRGRILQICPSPLLYCPSPFSSLPFCSLRLFTFTLFSASLPNPVRGSGERCELPGWQTVSGAFWVKNHCPHGSAIDINLHTFGERRLRRFRGYASLSTSATGSHWRLVKVKSEVIIKVVARVKTRQLLMYKSIAKAALVAKFPVTKLLVVWLLDPLLQLGL